MLLLPIATICTANIAGVKTAVATALNVYDIINARKLVINVDAAKKLEEVFA